jgi:hypothetical protein
MADLYELIERIQVTLASSSSPAKEQLRELHGELTNQIRRTNKRLRECDALMAKGLRSEAVQLAEQEPQLLDVVAILDFPELPEWNDFVAELGLTVAPELQIEIAADLNGAYSDDGPLKSHMKRFRISSLLRAPLKARIALLRKIAEVDSGNPIWESDLRSYEEARHRQMKDQFQVASRNQDFGELRDLAKELHGKWLSPPQKKFVQLRQVAAEQRLGELAEDLQDAYNDENFSWAASTRKEWEQVVGSCAQSDGVNKLQRLVQPALRWVTQQQIHMQNQAKFEEAVQKLQRAIDEGYPLPEIDRRYGMTLRIPGFELPDDVQESYLSVVSTHQRRKRLRLIIVAAVALIAVMGFGIFKMMN